MRVIDKRMFGADGELRDEVKKELEDYAKRPPETPAPPATEPKEPPPARKAEAPSEPAEALKGKKRADKRPADPRLAQLVSMLANQAGLLMGLLVDPLNPAGNVDLAAATSFIDMIACLQEKTTGNLSDEENRLVESVLYELRMAYVEQSRRHPNG